MGELLHGEVTEQIIGAAFEVHNALGPGHLEAVYEAALAHELQLRGLSVQRQVRYTVIYKGVTVGEFVADLVVEGKVVVENKATLEHHRVFEALVLNYLKCAGLRVALLLNFGGERLMHKRFIL